MGKFGVALICIFALVGHVIGGEFVVIITKVEGSTVTFRKGPGISGREVKSEFAIIAPNVLKVTKGEIDGIKPKGAKKGGISFVIKAGDPIEGGINNEIFTKTDDKNGISAHVTTNDRGQISKIVVLGFVTFDPPKE